MSKRARKKTKNVDSDYKTAHEAVKELSAVEGLFGSINSITTSFS